MVETISSGQDVYTKVITAAIQRQDNAMIARLNGVPNQNMVAAEARYHRVKGCIRSYTNPRNIKSASTRKSDPDSAYTQVAQMLLNEVTDEIMTNKRVYEMSWLMTRFYPLGDEMGYENLQCYNTQNLKRKLQQQCPDLAFIYQEGRSDLVCCQPYNSG